MDTSCIRPQILRSWRRSREAHAPCTGLPTVSLGNRDMERVLSHNEFLLSTARPVMEELLNNIHPTNNCIILTDTDGIYIHTLGNSAGFGRGATTPLRGLVSGEAIEGTTAMGICQVEHEPACVLGCEHYNPFFDGWTCLAAPIFDHENNPAGTLSITMERDSFNHHAFGLVIAAARTITEEMRLIHLLQETRTIMDILGEAVVVLDRDMRVRMINGYAKRLFHAQDHVEGEMFSRVAMPVEGDHMLEGDGEVRDCECCMKLADGSSLQCLYSSSPVPGGGLCLTLRESRRVNKLTNRLTRAKAIYHFSDILGDSKAIQQSIQLARKASGNSMTTLILGESGVGKELFAQAIHNASVRRSHPFIVVNCGAIPRDLVQSELFGYEAGAFTGAGRQGAPGKFELADGGTLFLDEIGDMPLAAQANLLRVLQEGEVTRVGGKRARRVDVRVVAATHRNLARNVETGTFRHDLYYRLNVLVINIPPLQQRDGDVRLLAGFFLNKLARSLGKTLTGFTPDAMECLESYHWPGNVRELENLVERTAVMAEGPLITREDLLPEVSSPVVPASEPPSCPPPATPLPGKPAGATESLDREKQRLSYVLSRARGNVQAAAREIGVSRVTLYAHIRRHGLCLDSFRR